MWCISPGHCLSPVPHPSFTPSFSFISLPFYLCPLGPQVFIQVPSEAIVIAPGGSGEAHCQHGTKAIRWFRGSTAIGATDEMDRCSCLRKDTGGNNNSTLKFTSFLSMSSGVYRCSVQTGASDFLSCDFQVFISCKEHKYVLLAVPNQISTIPGWIFIVDIIIQS